MEALPVQSRDTEKRAITRALRVALIASVAMAVILLALLASASGNTRLFEGRYPLLLGLAGGVALMLLVLVLELLRRLVTRYRRGLFGTRLMARMAGSFVLMTVVPVALVFFVAVQFVGRSIESWFDVPLERALESGLTLARASLDSMLTDLTQKSRVMAAELAETPAVGWPQALSRLREQSGVQEALVLAGNGRIITASGGQFARLVPDLPPADALRQARLTRQFARVEGGEPGSSDRALKLRVIVMVSMDGQRIDNSRYLQLVQTVPTVLAENAEAVQQGFRDFQQLSLSREGLKRIFRITLTLTFLLTVFAAVAGAFLLAGWLTGPLSELAAATRSVAEGDFRQVKDYTGRDELGVLTRSFNAMTRQLQEARSLVDRNQRELERVNARLESVLANLDAGVMVLDSDLCLTLANPGADRILGASLEKHLGTPLAELPGVGLLADEIRAAFNEQAAAGSASWQRQFVLGRSREQQSADGSGAGPAPDPSRPADQTLLARGSILPERRVGYVIVFDDISEVVSAQRALAWTEVARRLAHEIKNPLTPIQLAAERMAFKLRDKLPPADAEMLVKNTQTIVNQVQALKTMVDEFRDYARLPAAQLQALQINDLIEDVLRLYAAGDPQGAIRARLASDAPLVMGDATQLRQVFHNLLKNAQEAGGKGALRDAGVAAQGGEAGDPERMVVDVVSERVALADGRAAVRVIVRDHGSGFAPGMLGRAFEPYVTSKPRGTGLGLAIVKKIIDEHGARLDITNWQDDSGRVAGAQVAILFTKLPKSVENPGFDEAALRDGEYGRNSGGG
ncbi:MAG TPA: HAMP domain-containing protein [Burkholderiaceae bacterium]|nr:HAMP domain-containing protein [Burkholderiaceae bacterium]